VLARTRRYPPRRRCTPTALHSRGQTASVHRKIATQGIPTSPPPDTRAHRCRPTLVPMACCPQCRRNTADIRAKQPVLPSPRRRDLMLLNRTSPLSHYRLLILLRRLPPGYPESLATATRRLRPTSSMTILIHRPLVRWCCWIKCRHRQQFQSLARMAYSTSPRTFQSLRTLLPIYLIRLTLTALPLLAMSSLRANTPSTCSAVRFM
jgi:hypothetical protein